MIDHCTRICVHFSERASMSHNIQALFTPPPTQDIDNHCLSTYVPIYICVSHGLHNLSPYSLFITLSLSLSALVTGSMVGALFFRSVFLQNSQKSDKKKCIVVKWLVKWVTMRNVSGRCPPVIRQDIVLLNVLAR